MYLNNANGWISGKTSLSLYGDTADSYGLTVRSGSIGIGTTAPQATLDVRGENPSIWLRDTSSTRFLYMTTDETNSVLKIGSSYGAGGLYPIGFYMAASEKARIDTAGNFGIGTTSPTAKLHINGAGGSNDSALTMTSNE